MPGDTNTDNPVPAPLFHETVPVQPVTLKVELLPLKIFEGFALAEMSQFGFDTTLTVTSEAHGLPVEQEAV